MSDSPILSPGPTTKPSAKAAGFWVRLLALSVDYLTMWILYGIIIMLYLVMGVHEGLLVTLVLLTILYDWILHALQGATVGKMLCGIEVVQKDGNKPNVLKAGLRSLIKFGFGVALVPSLAWLPTVLFVISFVMLIANYDKKTLHDMGAQTRVIVSRGMSVMQGIGIFAVSYVMGILVICIGVVLFKDIFVHKAPALAQALIQQSTKLTDAQKKYYEQQLRDTWELAEKKPEVQVSAEPQTVDSDTASPYRHKLHGLQYINQTMYNEFLQPLDATKFDVDQDLVQSFGPILALPSRTGMNSIKIEFFFPFLPNALHHPNGLTFDMTPPRNENGKRVSFSLTKPEFEVQENKDRKIMHGYASLEYEGIPIEFVDVSFTVKLPTNVRKIRILGKDIQDEYMQYKEKVFDIERDQKKFAFSISGILDNYLGVVAYDKKDNVIEVFQQSSEDVAHSVRRYQYTFMSTPHRYELYITENFFIKSFPATVDMKHTFIKARDYYITVAPQPKQYFKKSIMNKHEIRFEKYKVEINDQNLNVNNLPFGKIAKDAWIHLEGKKVYVNGEVIN